MNPCAIASVPERSSGIGRRRSFPSRIMRLRKFGWDVAGELLQRFENSSLLVPVPDRRMFHDNGSRSEPRAQIEAKTRSRRDIHACAVRSAENMVTVRRGSVVRIRILASPAPARCPYLKPIPWRDTLREYIPTPRRERRRIIVYRRSQ